jgi:hypothetical protein
LLSLTCFARWGMPAAFRDDIEELSYHLLFSEPELELHDQLLEFVLASFSRSRSRIRKNAMRCQVRASCAFWTLFDLERHLRLDDVRFGTLAD